LGTDIHQPLRGRGTPKAGRKASPLGRILVSTAVILLVVGGAGWVAWLSRVPEPVEIAATAPEAAASSPVAADQAIIADEARDESILAESEETLASEAVPRLPGDSGAEVSTVLDENGNEITKIAPGTRSTPGAVILTPPNRTGQDPRLAHLPDPAIIEETAYGALPVRGANGERAFDIYARPWSGARGTRVAIIVGGLGISQTGTQHALRSLPEETTLAFASNGNSLKRWMQEARRRGHEILLQVPFEPFDYPAVDPGRGTLTVNADARENLKRLHEAMGQITNYTGITNFMGGRFLSTPDALEPVMRDLSKRGIMFVDDGTSARSLTDKFAKALAIPFAASDIVLDATQERGDILARLDDLERTARRNGQAIGIASAFEVSVDAIATWANEAKGRGIEIVAVSALADDPER
jgi:Uncharacterized protein conserved in bacteria